MVHPYFLWFCLTASLTLALASPTSARMYHTHYPFLDEEEAADSTTDPVGGTMAFGGGGGSSSSSAGQKVWCVGKPAATDEYMKRNLDYVCAAGGGGVDCRAIQPGGACFSPDTPIGHASYAMNLYYQKNGRNWWTCSFNNTGLLVSTDPSFGNCKYPAQWMQ